MLALILGIYIVIKWIGAWSQFDGAASVILFTCICIFAVVGFVGSLLQPMGILRFIGAIVNGGETGYGAILAPILWILFLILYPLGLVDWLAAWNILESNKGYVMSHEIPTVFDIITLIVALYMFTTSIIRIRKTIKGEPPY